MGSQAASWLPALALTLLTRMSFPGPAGPAELVPALCSTAASWQWSSEECPGSSLHPALLPCTWSHRPALQALHRAGYLQGWGNIPLAQSQ